MLIFYLHSSNKSIQCEGPDQCFRKRFWSEFLGGVSKTLLDVNKT